MVAACAVGLAAALVYAGRGLTLSHYDAKAHLVVARRIIDSLTPGWRQIGAVWLPLPHLLNAIPVQVDAWYRTGLFAVALSIVSAAAASGGLAAMVWRVTRSGAAAAAAATLFLANPNVLYLQSTPMTEPLLLGLMICGVAALVELAIGGWRGRVWPTGLLFAGACLTRYEAWPVTAAALALAALGALRDRAPARVWGSALARVAVFPMLAIAAFLVLSRATVGEWFVTGGFYIPHNDAHGRPFRALQEVWWGTRQIAGTVILLVAVAGAIALVRAVWRRSLPGSALVILALAGSAALPWYAFVSGHPFRIRYMVVLVTATAAWSAVAVSRLFGRYAAIAAAAIVAVGLTATPPFSTRAPMVLEAQWDRKNSAGRAEVTRCLVDRFDGAPILASMGSLAHYMQELSREGFALRDFIHEGIGEIWFQALDSPRRHAGWILIEEQAEGGDQLARLRASEPGFLDGFARVCEGGGVALYRRVDPIRPPAVPREPVRTGTGR